MDENIISNENLYDFILSLSMNIDNDVFELKEYAKANDVPVIRDGTKDLIELIIRIKKPKKILEIGTAIAYSTIIMARIDNEIKITTIEDLYILRALIRYKEDLEAFSLVGEINNVNNK